MKLDGVKYWLGLLKIFLHLSKNSASVLDVSVEFLNKTVDDVIILSVDGFQGSKALSAFDGSVEVLSGNTEKLKKFSAALVLVGVGDEIQKNVEFLGPRFDVARVEIVEELFLWKLRKIPLLIILFDLFEE